jgi:hypothetical protein
VLKWAEMSTGTKMRGSVEISRPPVVAGGDGAGTRLEGDEFISPRRVGKNCRVFSLEFGIGRVFVGILGGE